MRLTFDDDAGAIYVQVREAAVARTERVEPGVHVDLDAAGDLLSCLDPPFSKAWTPTG